MMRGGLWQKQKRPSACLLCRYTRCLRSARCTPGIALRTYWDEAPGRIPKSPLASIPTKPAQPAGWGTLGGKDGPPVSSQPLQKPTWRPIFAKSSASSSDALLLPHEISARERLLKQKRETEEKELLRQKQEAEEKQRLRKKQEAEETARLLKQKQETEERERLLKQRQEAEARERVWRRKRDLEAQEQLLLKQKQEAKAREQLLLRQKQEIEAQERLLKQKPGLPVQEPPVQQPHGVVQSFQQARGAKSAPTPISLLDDDSLLLPHERAARERLMRRNNPAVTDSEPAQPDGTPRQTPRGGLGEVSWLHMDGRGSRGIRPSPLSEDNEWGNLKRRNNFPTTRQPLGSGTRLGSFSDRASDFETQRSVSSNPQSAKSEFWARAQDRFPAAESTISRVRENLGPRGTFGGLDTTARGGGWGGSRFQSDRNRQSSLGGLEDIRKHADWTPVRQAPVPTQSAEEGWKKLEDLGRQAAQSISKPKDEKTVASEDWDWADDLDVDRRQTHLATPFQLPSYPAAGGSHNLDSSHANPLANRSYRDRDRFDRSSRDAKPKKAKPSSWRTDSRDDEFDADSHKEKQQRRRERKAEKERARLEALEESGPVPIKLPEFISVANLGTALGVKLSVFLGELEQLGFENITKDNILTGETAALVAQEYGFEPTVETGEDEDLKPRPLPEDPSSLPLRPPVVTIMGHVDHGKTTLLDYLRKSSIVDQEHGGITQHIGAFSVKMSTGKQITFLDTPGHAAFLTMRQRGADVTDMVILVVAADDSVKPQTLEALKHARSSKVPIIVAINKVDKESANVDRVKSDLAANGVEIEDYGGDVQVVCVSGKTGKGMEDLEENILLLAEMLDIRAEPDGMAEGWVLESSIKPIGRVATVLVKRGTLRPGDYIVAGTVHAKIRSLRNEAGVEVDEAPPGTAVEILGWKDPPDAGDMILQASNEDKAKIATRYRQELKERTEALHQHTQMEQAKRDKVAEEEAEKAALEKDPEAEEESTGGAKTVGFLIKGDVHGSVEAVCATVLEIGNNEVRPRILQSATGQINESDVEMAATSGSCIINFNNPVQGYIKRMASEAGVRILDHNIIYHLAEEVRDTLSELLPPNIIVKVIGETEILQVFPINIKGRVYKNIAGCRVRNGQVLRNAKCRVVRHGEVLWEGELETLKQGKKNVAEVKKGAECGISFASEWNEFRQGDNVQIIEEVKEKRRL
ncbi:hypothetical protein B0T25DRAFT_284004 [Lasiosphaeria hispida]|uniref:Translation initiation factor IF-2, mitochondrial n=1 Tax=Lasiosphaeria hispida TaxID=260671 RepID=A0AAJ0HBR1_9PEZI|nr:hypothetical protein B0T25DRAFT_284004 [Lasiosphaeria hispida]